MTSAPQNLASSTTSTSSHSSHHLRTQNVETDIDNLNDNEHDESMPLLPSGSPPVTVTHFTASTKGGKIEKIKLTPESSSVSSAMTNKTDNTKQKIVTNLDEIEENEILLTEGPATLIKTANKLTQQITSANNNPFTSSTTSVTNPFFNTNSNSPTNNNTQITPSSTSTITASITATNNNKTASSSDNNNPFDQPFDAITAALLTCASSTNPFHNPFLMSVDGESNSVVVEVDRGQGGQRAKQLLEVKQEVVENPGCTKTKESFDNRVSLLDSVSSQKKSKQAK